MVERTMTRRDWEPDGAPDPYDDYPPQTEPAVGEREHGLPARLGGFWLSLPCRTGDGKCDGTGGCACTCHDGAAP